MKIIDLSKPCTGEARKKGHYYYVTWHNQTKDRLAITEVYEKEGLLWVDSAKKPELKPLYTALELTSGV